MADTTNSSVKKSNLNEHWKNLDAIFQVQLRQYVLAENKDKFQSLAKAVGFDCDAQIELLFASIQAFTEQFTSHRSRYIARNPESPLSQTYMRNEPNKANKTSSNVERKKRVFVKSNSDDDHQDKIRKSPKKIKKSLYRISKSPERKRRKINKKAKPNDNAKDAKARKKKRKKKNKVNGNVVQTLWNDDANLSKKKQKQLEKEDIYVVDRIVDHRKIGNKKEYYVSWVGYDDKTWEPSEHLNMSTIKQYVKDLKSKTAKNKSCKIGIKRSLPPYWEDSQESDDE
eukprot:586035_1